MTVRVVLDRIGHSRVAYDAIPIRARVVQQVTGQVNYGNDLLAHLKPIAVQTAKDQVLEILRKRYWGAVDIQFIDKTNEWEQE